VNRVWRLLGCIRYREVLLLQGAPVMGMILSAGETTSPQIATVALFVLANFLLVAHIWTLNDWADVRVDVLDRNKAPHVFTSKGIASRAMLVFSMALLVASLGLFAWLASGTFWIACGIALLGFLYSFPRIQGKALSCSHPLCIS
jgi:4-hydroxybenzoate polyprenyltransferase